MKMTPGELRQHARAHRIAAGAMQDRAIDFYRSGHEEAGRRHFAHSAALTELAQAYQDLADLGADLERKEGKQP